MYTHSIYSALQQLIQTPQNTTVTHPLSISDIMKVLSDIPKGFKRQLQTRPQFAHNGAFWQKVKVFTVVLPPPGDQAASQSIPCNPLSIIVY